MICSPPTNEKSRSPFLGVGEWGSGEGGGGWNVCKVIFPPTKRMNMKIWFPLSNARITEKKFKFSFINVFVSFQPEICSKRGEKYFF